MNTSESVILILDVHHNTQLLSTDLLGPPVEKAVNNPCGCIKVGAKTGFV